MQQRCSLGMLSSDTACPLSSMIKMIDASRTHLHAGTDRTHNRSSSVAVAILLTGQLPDLGMGRVAEYRLERVRSLLAGAGDVFLHVGSADYNSSNGINATDTRRGASEGQLAALVRLLRPVWKVVVDSPPIPAHLSPWMSPCDAAGAPRCSKGWSDPKCRVGHGCRSASDAPQLCDLSAESASWAQYGRLLYAFEALIRHEVKRGALYEWLLRIRADVLMAPLALPRAMDVGAWRKVDPAVYFSMADAPGRYPHPNLPRSITMRERSSSMISSDSAEVSSPWDGHWLPKDGRVGIRTGFKPSLNPA